MPAVYKLTVEGVKLDEPYLRQVSFRGIKDPVIARLASLTGARLLPEACRSLNKRRGKMEKFSTNRLHFPTPPGNVVLV